MKQLSFILLILFGASASAQEVKIRVQEICEFNPINNARIVLKGNSKPDIEAKFDKNQKCYILAKIPDGYDAIVAYHKKYDPERILKNGKFPQNIMIKLQCKGTVVWTDSVKGNPRQTDRYSRQVNARDDYKILIALKDSYPKTYGEVRRTIDSLVAPYGLEYIDNLAPKAYFFKIDGTYLPSYQNEWVSNQPPRESLRDLINNPEYHKYFEGGGLLDNKEISKKCYYVLAYRKKRKARFEIFDDSLVETAKKNLPQLRFGKLFYGKFNALYPEENTKRPWKFMTCGKLKKHDRQLMNYQFIRKYDNDSTRVLFMDYTLHDVYLDKNGINNRGDMTVIAIPEYRFRHEFLLDRPLADFRIWPARSYYFAMDDD